MTNQSVAIYAARPRVEVDGIEDRMVAACLVEMEATETAGGLSALELRLLNVAEVEGQGAVYPFETDANPLIDLGKPIRVVWGDNYDPQEVFRGTITGLEFVGEGGSPPHLVVLAEDGLQAARLARRTKLHEVATLDDLVAGVAAPLGLRVVSAGLTQPVGQELQLNETDLGFLRRVCGRFDTDLQMVGDALQVSPRRAVDRGTLALELGVTLTRVRALADLADQVTGVTLGGWDPETGETFQLEAGAGADLGPGTGRTGAQLLARSFGPRVAHLGAVEVASQAEGQAVADAMAAARARRFVTVEGEATGDPRLRVGTKLALTGLGPRFDNTYYVTEARHRFDQAEGYRTEFRAECGFWGAP